MLRRDCCAFAFAAVLLALSFARGLFWACCSCSATKSAKHLARFLLVAGLTELTARFAPAPQNQFYLVLLGAKLLLAFLLLLVLLLRGLLQLAYHAEASPYWALAALAGAPPY